MYVRTDLKAGSLLVYGTQDCSWTKKQLSYLEKKNIPHEFVDCSTGQCPDFVQAFPTLVKEDGRVLVGYSQL